MMNHTDDIYEVSLSPQKMPDVTVASPCLLNPNLYERLAEVCCVEGVVSEVDTKRKWVTAVCDGLPYTSVSKIISTAPEKYRDGSYLKQVAVTLKSTWLYPGRWKKKCSWTEFIMFE